MGRCSSLSLEDSVGLLLQVACDFTGGAIGLCALSSQILELELLLLLDLKKVHIDGVVTVRQNTTKEVRNMHDT